MFGKQTQSMKRHKNGRSKGDTRTSYDSYVPGQAYTHFLKEKKKPSYTATIRNFKNLLGVKIR
ncbi:hypothetical protein WKH56_08235 [Priestia sp. SB1]|uniref:hypothetical protein n=1 Tax=Priestia sp. SB1 TaxID=3132359 RepID=UPI00316BCCF4